MHSIIHKRQNHLQPDAVCPEIPWLFQSLKRNHSHLEQANWESEMTRFKPGELQAYRLALMVRKEALSADRRHPYYSRQKLMGLSLLIQDFNRRGEKKGWKQEIK